MSLISFSVVASFTQMEEARISCCNLHPYCEGCCCSTCFLFTHSGMYSSFNLYVTQCAIKMALWLSLIKRVYSCYFKFEFGIPLSFCFHSWSTYKSGAITADIRAWKTSHDYKIIGLCCNFHVLLLCCHCIIQG